METRGNLGYHSLEVESPAESGSTGVIVARINTREVTVSHSALQEPKSKNRAYLYFCFALMFAGLTLAGLILTLMRHFEDKNLEKDKAACPSINFDSIDCGYDNSHYRWCSQDKIQTWCDDKASQKKWVTTGAVFTAIFAALSGVAFWRACKNYPTVREALRDAAQQEPANGVNAPR